MQVIDLSENNGNFNLQRLKDAGVNNVILRLCWIGNKNNHTKDKQVENYMNQCRNLGINIIGYYVYSYCNSLDSIKSAIIYIDNLIKNLYIDKNSEIYLDLEDEQISYLSKEELTNLAIHFCNHYLEHGYKSGIYANTDWFKNHLNIEKLKNYKIWLAQWTENKPNVDFNINIWQYTDKCYIDNKRFDSNEYYGSQVKKEGDFEMKEYINGSTTEIVYQDLKCTKQIGYLHPHEIAKCYGLVEDKALIVYTIDGTSNKKSGFVKWLGGVK